MWRTCKTSHILVFLIPLRSAASERSRPVGGTSTATLKAATRRGSLPREDNAGWQPFRAELFIAPSRYFGLLFLRKAKREEASGWNREETMTGMLSGWKQRSALHQLEVMSDHTTLTSGKLSL